MKFTPAEQRAIDRIKNSAGALSREHTRSPSDVVTDIADAIVAEMRLAAKVATLPPIHDLHGLDRS